MWRLREPQCIGIISKTQQISSTRGILYIFLLLVNPSILHPKWLLFAKMLQMKSQAMPKPSWWSRFVARQKHLRLQTATQRHMHKLLLGTTIRLNGTTAWIITVMEIWDNLITKAINIGLPPLPNLTVRFCTEAFGSGYDIFQWLRRIRTDAQARCEH